MSNTTPTTEPPRFVYSVSHLATEVKELLEGTFPLIWVEGEISNLSAPASGHWYFSLKDANAQVRCAMFRMRNTHVRFKPENGVQILIRARVSLYTPRGDFQLIVEHMEEAGDGALRRAFEELKQRLEQEGLFAPERKKPLPASPARIGVITSPTGAAIRDILTVLKRRSPWIPVLIFPVAVQGDKAAQEIAHAIRRASERRECDVLIVGRGGGSLEDLRAFNEEVVARAIAACEIPIVSAVGHEIDFTIADFVADRRAPTPSAAAELVGPDRMELLTRLKRDQSRLIYNLRSTLRHKQSTLKWLQQRCQLPQQRLQMLAQRLDEIERRLLDALRHRRREAAHRLATLSARLKHQSPSQRLQRLALRFENVSLRLNRAMRHRLQLKTERLTAVSHHLDAVSPLATLSRGYAIVEKLPERILVRSSRQIKRGDTVETRLGTGRIQSEVTEVIDE
ncbi:MAG: exodeoxyribonuclease VII large subunit [Pseudomonadota bacterium]